MQKTMASEQYEEHRLSVASDQCSAQDLPVFNKIHASYVNGMLVIGRNIAEQCMSEKAVG